MSRDALNVERRRHRRFRGRDGTHAILRGAVKKLAQIIDVSRGGLAFRYIDVGERPQRSLQLDITYDRNGFLLDSLCFKTISDFSARREFPYSTIPMRRRGGQFMALNKDQRSDLEYFIQNYTVGEA